jgi:gamma-glutamylcyclotransferase (GGCT)/AIG2-like uncharacterized protein YtfP
MTDLIALYGTLRRDATDPEAPSRAGLVEFVEPCRLTGKLMDLGKYPGFVPGNEGPVTADLFRIVSPDAFPVFDDWEDYDPENIASSLYRREVIRLDAPHVDAWVYIWNGAPDDGAMVPSGDWFRR